MKRLSSLSSFRGLDEHDSNLIPISSPVDGKRKYEDRFQSALHLDGMEEVEEEEDELCSIGQSCLGEKKRRLSVEQVKALEKSFEVENKLDPERKVRLAQEIGLQPRQVSVWFQNRRARWKTKQLEHDYGALKARHDALKVECEALHRDKEVLLAKISELKSKLENSQASAVKLEIKAAEEGRPTAASLTHKDGASDSDSSAVFNDEAGASANYSSVQALDERHHLVGFRYHSSPLLFTDRAQEELSYMEEGFLSGEELCSNLLSEEEAPSLSWYCSGGWE